MSNLYGPAGSTYWSTLPPCTFGTIKFPVESSRIEGGQRDHVHEFPHTPGGAPELLGRSLYIFHVTAKFDVNFSVSGSYPGLYPQDLDTLLGFFEQGSTLPLRLSQMSQSVPCYAVKWTREQSAKCRSGETVHITLREDQTSLFLFTDLVDNSTLEFSGANLSAQLASVQSQLSNATMNFFAQLTQAIVNVVSWEQQTIGQFTQQYYDAVQAVQTLCGAIDVQPDMQTALTWPVIDALHDVWLAAVQASQPSLAGAVLSQKVNPITQDIGQLSIWLYAGDSSQAGAILALNTFPDPMSIPAGTVVNYYPTS